MRPEPGKQRKLLAPNEDIDRVDLNEPHTIDGSSQMPTINSASRSRVGEALSAESNPTRLGTGEISRLGQRLGSLCSVGSARLDLVSRRQR